MKSYESPKVDEFRGLDMSALWTDEAYLNVTSDYNERVFLYRRNENCDGCPFQRIDGQFVDKSDLSMEPLKLSVHYPWYFRFRKNNDSELINQGFNDPDALCTQKVFMGEFGVYDLRLTFNGTCAFDTALEPVNAYLAILYSFLILLLLSIAFRVFEFLDKRDKFKRPKEAVKNWLRQIGFEIKPDKVKDSGEEEQKAAAAKKRVKSLDTFRGITIALMIFVNDAAGGYYFFEHTTWNGLYLADLAFPWFVWIMGFCIPMSVRSSARKKTPVLVSLWAIFVRCVKLFLLGFFWGNTGYIDLRKVRVFGVLQRQSIGYLFTASTAIIVASLSDNSESNSKLRDWRRHFIDITTHWGRWIVALSCVLIHTTITFLMPVPGCPTGYLGPGGLHNDAKTRDNNCIGGAAGYIDSVILGPHIYQYPTAKDVYESSAYDPEGILGCLTTIFQTFLGYQAGQIILSYSGHRQRVIRFFLWGVANGAMGLLLCEASLNDGWIPINKNLWSLSYVFSTTALAFFLMAVVYIVVDIKEWWGGEPFFYAGMNSIVLYLGHSSAHAMLPFNYVVGPMRTHWARLPESIWGTSLWMLVGYILYKKKAFVVV